MLRIKGFKIVSLLLCIVLVVGLVSTGASATLKKGYLTINYVKRDTGETFAQHRVQLSAKSSYNVVSPVIENYKAEQERVQGTMPKTHGQDVNVTVYYNRTAYTVTFDPNGGVGSQRTQLIDAGVAVVLNPGEVYTREGYVHMGWKYNANGATADFALGAEVTNLGNVTLYAHWREILSLIDIKGDQNITTVLGRYRDQTSNEISFYIRFNDQPLTAADLDKLTFTLDTWGSFAALSERSPVEFGVGTFAHLLYENGFDSVTRRIEGTVNIDGLDYTEVVVTASVYKSSIVRVHAGYLNVTTEDAYSDVLMPGDVNADGRVSTSDYAVVSRIITGLVPTPGKGVENGHQFELHDVDGNGRIGPSDFAILFRMVTNEIPSN